MTPSDRVLDAMGVRDREGIYVIGVNERHATFHAQQCRALNLVFGLEERRPITDEKIVVVGGGGAGTTAASAAALLGAKVALLERADRPLTLQEGSSRGLHPHVYDWPADGWDDADAGLPVMNWTAGTAGDVIRHLRSQWLSYVSGCQHPIEVFTRCSDISIEPEHTGWRLSWNSPGRKSEVFGIVILAVGFGQEAGGRHALSYWRDNDIHQEPLVSTLVSGCGDGGLTDVLRLALPDFRHEELIELASGDWLGHVHDSVLSMERDQGRDLGRLNDFYLNVSIPELKERLAGRARDLGKIALNGPANLPFDRRSSALNRLLVGQLMQLGLPYIPGRLVKMPTSVECGEVVFKQASGLVSRKTFERVVIRHGTVSPAPLDAFPEIASSLKLSREVAEALPIAMDFTRLPLWSATTFTRGGGVR